MPSKFSAPPNGMPANAGEVYCYLKGEIIRTRAKWLYYNQLFMGSEQRVQLLNKAGGNFFAEIQNILTSDLILSIARLTDPSCNKYQENLTVELFIERLRDSGCAELATQLSERNTVLRKLISPLRTRRSKRIAHYDIATILTPATSPLPGLTLGDIRAAIEAIEGILGVVHTHFTGGTFLWDALQTERDANSLMVQLCKAAVYDRLAAHGTIERRTWRAEWERINEQSSE